MYEYIENNYYALSSEIDELCTRLGRGPVRLVAVTKSGTDGELLALAGFGATDIGENRPQELRRRGELLSEAGYTPHLHEIGNLQRNKVKYIIERVALIHSLDSIDLAREIDRQAKRVGRRVPVLIEVNSADEDTKGGINPEKAMEFCQALGEFDSLIVSGLMTMGPVCEVAEDIRPYFRKTRELFDRMVAAGCFEGEPMLSMGMTDSYKIAIEEGATIVRVGRKIFRKE